MNDMPPKEGELLGPADTTGGALAVIARAEIDAQIATAHAYPRSMAIFKKRALEMVSMDEDTAESCLYRRPVGKKKNEETGRYEQAFAEGMSVRMAEIVACCFGNLHVSAILVESTPRYVKARGQARDLESNYASQCDVVESTVDSEGRPFSERMRVVVAKAALAKARRDATFQVVPRALCKPIEDMARKVAIGDATTLERRRGQVMKWVVHVGVDPARVFAALGIAGEADIGTDELETLTGLKTAIKEGEATLDEAFPKLVGDAGPKKENLKDRLREGSGKPTTGDAGTDSQAPTAEQKPQPQADAQKPPQDAKPAAQAEPAKPAADKPAAEKPAKRGAAKAGKGEAPPLAMPATGSTLEQWKQALTDTAAEHRPAFMKAAQEQAPREFLDSLTGAFDDLAFGGN